MPNWQNEAPSIHKINHVDHPFTNPRVLSYCPGILGLERGLKRAVGSVRTLAYVEIEAFICENLLAGMEAGLVDAAPIWCNLKTFPAEQFRGVVDGIMGGYPCQPFSHAGERKGTEDPRHLYPYLEQHIRTIRPVWCFFENVSGHLSLGFEEVRESLSDLGYNVEAGIFTAEEVGAPHIRERLFILAIRRDYLAHSESTGKRGRQFDIHYEDGRPVGELQQQPNGPGAEDMANPQSLGKRSGGSEPSLPRLSIVFPRDSDPSSCSRLRSSPSCRWQFSCRANSRVSIQNTIAKSLPLIAGESYPQAARVRWAQEL